MKKMTGKNTLMLFLTAFIWGTAFVAQSVGMDYIGPFTFTCVRSLIGGIFLIPCICFLDKWRAKNDGDEVVGIDAEFAAAIADKLGMDLKIEDMAFDSIIPAVQSGKADIGAAGMTVTEDRATQVDFSDSYYTGVQVIIVTDDSDIAEPDDLKGKKIGVQQGTTGDIYSTDDFGDDNVERFNKGMEAVQALQQGKIDAVIIDNQPAKTFVEENEGLKILETSYVEEDYALAIKKGNDDLVKKVNDAIKELKEDGTFDKIVAKYITD